MANPRAPADRTPAAAGRKNLSSFVWDCGAVLDSLKEYLKVPCLTQNRGRCDPQHQLGEEEVTRLILRARLETWGNALLQGARKARGASRPCQGMPLSEAHRRRVTTHSWSPTLDVLSRSGPRFQHCNIVHWRLLDHVLPENNKLYGRPPPKYLPIPDYTLLIFRGAIMHSHHSQLARTILIEA
jgi:hypothetical protein